MPSSAILVSVNSLATDLVYGMDVCISHYYEASFLFKLATKIVVHHYIVLISFVFTNCRCVFSANEIGMGFANAVDYDV